MAFFNWSIKTYIWKSGDRQCGVFTTHVSLSHTTMFTYSHASRLLNQSECAYFLGCFIKDYIKCLYTTISARRGGGGGAEIILRSLFLLASRVGVRDLRYMEDKLFLPLLLVRRCWCHLLSAPQIHDFQLDVFNNVWKTW